MSLILDCNEVESKTGRRGYLLKCPQCDKWVPGLFSLEDGSLLCAECVRAVSSKKKDEP